MSTIVAAAETADRIDYWIRRHVIPHCYNIPLKGKASSIPLATDAFGSQQLGKASRISTTPSPLPSPRISLYS